MSKTRSVQYNHAAASLPGKIRNLAPTARHCALWALLFADSGMTAQQALAAALSCLPASASNAEMASLAPVERNLCSELVYGYLRTELRIAFILSKVLLRPQSLPRPLLHVLGLAVYGLLFQDMCRITLLFRYAGDPQNVVMEGLTKVANGALRSIQRLADAPIHEDFYLPTGAESGCAEQMGLFVPCLSGLWDTGAALRRDVNLPAGLLPARGARCVSTRSILPLRHCVRACLRVGAFR